MSTTFDIRRWATQAGIQTTGGFAVIAECVTMDELQRFAEIAIASAGGVQALSAAPAEQQATKETSGGFHVWRDISTAPKDGSRFVAIGYNYGLYSEGRHICVAQWFRGCWMETSDWNEASELQHLTHWLPLPSPPDNAAELNDLDVSVSPQQAAPKAAPGELHDHQILAITTAYEQGVGKGRQAHESGKEIANPYGTGYRCDLAWQYGYKEGKEQAERIAKAAPTPPAEQQAITPEPGNSASAQGAAITTESGAVYAELPDFDSGDEPIWEAIFKWAKATPGSDAHKKADAVSGAVISALRDFADRTHALRMQAAPQAAPGEPVNGWPVEATIYKRRDEWVLELSGTINDCAFTCRHTQPGYLQPEDVAGLPSLYSEGIAPQQEAQEPVPISEAIERMAADRYKVVPSHESMFHRWAVVAGTGTQQLYLGREVECQNMARKFAGAFLDGVFVAMQQAAPQPAPAPLSDDAKRLDWMDKGGGERVLHVGTDWYTRPTYGQPCRKHENLRAAIDAAIAAQGGK